VAVNTPVILLLRDSVKSPFGFFGEVAAWWGNKGNKKTKKKFFQFRSRNDKKAGFMNVEKLIPLFWFALPVAVEKNDRW
jgi:hypothetical protein